MKKTDKSDDRIEDKMRNFPVVFVVEDDEALSRLIMKNLQREGIETEGALSGAEAIDWLDRNPADLMLLDYSLPDITGKEIVEALRERNCDVPFVVMTGYGDEKIAVDMMKLGARDYLVKESGFLDLLPHVLKRIFEQLSIEKRLALSREELRDTNETLKAILEASPIPIFTLDLEGRVDFIWNPAAERLLGWKKEEVLGEPYPSIVKDNKEEFVSNLNSILSDKEINGMEARSKRRDGTPIDYRIYTAPLYNKKGDVYRILALLLDITERKRAREAMQDSKERLSLFIDSATDSFDLFDSELNLIELNRNSLNMHPSGTKKEDVIGKNILEIAPNVKETGIYEKYVDVIRTGKPAFFENVISHPGYGNIYLYVKAFKAGDGLGINTVDITEKMLAEEALRIRYYAMESSINAIAIADLEGNLTYVNNSFLKMWGYDSVKDIIGKPVLSFWQSEERASNVVKTLENEGNWIGEMVAKGRDGLPFDLYLSGNMVYDDKGSPICMTGSFMDITHQKLLQNQLIRSERLAATGQLAASIAHEINSPLQGIASLLNVIRDANEEDEELSKNIDIVKHAYDSIRDTVKKLLDLNRPGKENNQFININRIIEDTVGLLKSHLKKNRVKILLNLSSSMPDITASPQQLGQVFMNLINNAVEAMTESSKPMDGLETGEPTDRELTINTDMRKDDIIIKVADKGPGISKKDMEHIFDPFYTRKKEMGIGIGLSICHGIIEDHKGSIAAKNSPEGGAVFTITLPAM